MRNKKIAVAIGVLVLLIVAGGIVWAVRGNIQLGGKQDPKVSELAFDKLDLSAHPGVGFELVYESDSYIIFYGVAGLFGYDLEQCEITFSVDFVKAYGKEGSVKGSYGTSVEADSKGENLVLTYTDPDDPDDVKDAYFIHLPTLTYRRGKYQPLESVFPRGNIVGVVRPGGTLKDSVYIRDDEQWVVFEGYSASRSLTELGLYTVKVTAYETQSSSPTTYTFTVRTY